MKTRYICCRSLVLLIHRFITRQRIIIKEGKTDGWNDGERRDMQGGKGNEELLNGFTSFWLSFNRFVASAEKT